MMERKMRRFRQLLSDDSTKEILSEATNGTLSLIDSDGSPYGVPLSFVYDGDSHIYFHCAPTGHKIDCIEHCPDCSFCVIGQDKIMPAEFTSYFRSVIVKGTIRRMTETDEIIKGLHLLCEKYSPGIDPTHEIEKFLNHVAVLRLDILSMTGKESIELVKQHNTSK